MITINIKRGKLRRAKIVGDEAELLTELSAIIDTLKEKGIKKERIKTAIEIGLTDDKMGLLLKELEKHLDKMMSDLDKETKFKSYDEFMED